DDRQALGSCLPVQSAVAVRSRLKPHHSLSHHHLEQIDGFIEALDFMRTERLDADGRVREGLADGIGDDDLASPGNTSDPRGEVYGRAVVVTFAIQHRPGVNADAQRRNVAAL